MCTYTKLIENAKYKANKKNGGIVPRYTDQRVRWVPIACGNCMECRKKKSREWQARLLEDIKEHKNGIFITLTFSDQSIAELTDIINKEQIDKETGEVFKRNIKGYQLDNLIATIAMRRFNERWRKKYKKAIRHWMVTELGHNGTQNIHLHGIMWTELNKLEAYKEIEEIWKYGHIWPREKQDRINTYVNEKTVTYTTKYVSKLDQHHKNYKSIILTSAGIGSNYLKGYEWKQNKFNNTNTNTGYRTKTGHIISLPIYWRNKIYTENEREKLWLQILDKEERWIHGEKVDISKGLEQYNSLLEHYRELNRKLGYGTSYKNYNKIQQEHKQRILMQETRIAKGKAKKANTRPTG